MTQAEPPAPATSTAVEPSTPAIPGRNTKKRKLAVGLLIFFGSLCLLIGIFATWVDKVALDSDNWSDTSTQALEQPAVRTAVSEYLTDQLYANVDVRASSRTPCRRRPSRSRGRSPQALSRTSSARSLRASPGRGSCSSGRSRT